MRVSFVFFLLCLAPGLASANVACIDEATGGCSCTADAAVCESTGGTPSTDPEHMRLCCHVGEPDASVVCGGPDAGVDEVPVDPGDAAAVSLSAGGVAWDCECACDGCDVASLEKEAGFLRWLRAALSAVRGAAAEPKVTLPNGGTAACACSRQGP